MSGLICYPIQHGMFQAGAYAGNVRGTKSFWYLLQKCQRILPLTFLLIRRDNGTAFKNADLQPFGVGGCEKSSFSPQKHSCKVANFMKHTLGPIEMLCKASQLPDFSKIVPQLLPLSLDPNEAPPLPHTPQDLLRHIALLPLCQQIQDPRRMLWLPSPGLKERLHLFLDICALQHCLQASHLCKLMP